MQQRSRTAQGLTRTPCNICARPQQRRGRRHGAAARKCRKAPGRSRARKGSGSNVWRATAASARLTCRPVDIAADPLHSKYDALGVHVRASVRAYVRVRSQQFPAGTPLSRIIRRHLAHALEEH